LTVVFEVSFYKKKENGQGGGNETNFFPVLILFRMFSSVKRDMVSLDFYEEAPKETSCCRDYEEKKNFLITNSCK
jgi:hypothetical protein